MIQLQNLAKRYGAQVLFEHISIQLPTRGVVGLIGPNGAGKTTLMNIIAGLDVAETGQVSIPKGIQIGYLVQDVEQVGAGSVLETVLQPFADILNLEAKLEALALKTQQGGDTNEILQQMELAQTQYDAIDAHTLPERGKQILSGLGFDDVMQAKPFTQMSGGWRMRVVLAQLLLQAPHVLLLDEPTNHLDIDALLWLESFLAQYPGLIILTSHDRTFLDRMATHIISLEDGSAKIYPGNYTAYQEARANFLELQAKALVAQAKEREQMEQFINRFRAKATKAKQVQSRIKQLEKKEELAPLPQKRRIMNIKVPTPPPAPKILVECKQLTKDYGPHHVFSGVDWTLTRGQKVALMGPNGAGKSTLLKLIAGIVEPTAGEIRLGGRVEIAYYAQHQLESLNPQHTVLESLYSVEAAASQNEVRALLGAFLFSGSLVDKKVAVLSGGEKARLSLARLLIRPKNLLLLDEPTNHLDMESRDVVAEALEAFEGTLMVVSHDRDFLNGFANHVIALHAQRFESYPGNADDYVWHLEQQQKKQQPITTLGQEKVIKQEVQTTTATQSFNVDKTQITATDKSAGQIWKEQKLLRSEFRKCLRQLESSEQTIAQCRQKLADPALSENYQLLWQIQADFDRAKQTEQEQLKRWESLIAQGRAIGLDLLAQQEG